jgi:hypothetical protein
MIPFFSNSAFNQGNRLLFPFHPNQSKSKTVSQDAAIIFFASCFIIFSPISIPLPDGLSHWVTTHTTSNLLSLFKCSRKGTPIGAEEQNTTL